MNDGPTLLVCLNHRRYGVHPSCGGRGAQAVLDALRQAARARPGAPSVRAAYCFGRCGEGPNARLVPAGRFWSGLTVADCPAVVEQAMRPG